MMTDLFIATIASMAMVAVSGMFILGSSALLSQAFRLRSRRSIIHATLGTAVLAVVFFAGECGILWLVINR